MPKLKMKTRSAAKKRFFPLKSGKIKRAKANLKHKLTKKQTAQKRNLGQTAYVPETSIKHVRVWLPYGA
jgi:large subunit ribosomal protein L35